MMIYNEGFDAVVEALYSGSELTPYLSKADTVVNPTTDKYYGKTIIISMPTKKDLLSKLVMSNRIISRIHLDLPDGSYLFNPYKDKDISLLPMEYSLVTADKEYFKQIKCMVLNNHVYVEVPEYILDKEYNGDRTFLGFINKILTK